MALPIAMHQPPHPGEFIAGVYLEPCALSLRQVAERLGVSAFHVSAAGAEQEQGHSAYGPTAVGCAGAQPGELAGAAGQHRPMGDPAVARPFRPDADGADAGLIGLQ